MLPSDIVRRIQGQLGREEADYAIELLGTFSCLETVRVIRAIVYLAEGDLGRIEHYIDCAKIDYRDVLLWGEYDRDGNRLRNFNEPFCRC